MERMDSIDNLYGISLRDDNPSNGVTSIAELKIDQPKDEVISFLDDTKHIRKCQISMVNHQTGKEFPPLQYNCYWCRHPFSSKPIGCPIRYVPSQVVKQYHSEITKDRKVIKENITREKRQELEKKKNKHLSLIVNEYYETDGIFCSFNCCRAWILNNQHVPLYKDSDALLLRMYNELHNVTQLCINPAPHWRLLKEYGGTQDILQFRTGFNNVEHHAHGQLILRPIGMLYESKLKF